jgi:hypothetical protein
MRDAQVNQLNSAGGFGNDAGKERILNASNSINHRNKNGAASCALARLEYRL